MFRFKRSSGASISKVPDYVDNEGQDLVKEYLTPSKNPRDTSAEKK